MKALVIAEKPSVGRDIARVLGCRPAPSGAMEGRDYVVTWALGHLVTLADPEAYDKKYEKWEMSTLPMLPKEHKLVVIEKTRKQYQLVKSQLFRADIGSVIIATDAGREGELVARWILEKSGAKKPLKRLWISSVTDKAIRDGFAHLRDGRDYDNLYRAAQARAEADWLVGMNGTRALTCKYNAQLSCGRVQTPTLAIVQKREEDIRSFVPKDYYGLVAFGKGIRFTWKDKKSQGGRISDIQKAQELEKSLKGRKMTIIRADKRLKSQMPPELYDLTALQRDANVRFGLSPKQTLDIMQRLYENHKVLTYPRTDSRYLTEDIVPTLKERLDACGTGPYRALAAAILSKPIKAGKHFVNNAKVTDHHAIIPTEQFVALDHMTIEERKVYDLVVRRFLSVLFPAFEYEEVTLEGEAAGEMFTARGRTVKAEGWKAVYQGSTLPEEGEEEPEEDRSQALPQVRSGESFPIDSVKITSGKTKPPAYFTEATLLAAMENPVKYMESQNKAEAKTLGETGGLGTVATRADIIEKLYGSFLIEKKGNEVHLTQKARQLLRLVPEDLRKPELTARWEMRLADIAAGKAPQGAFLGDIRRYTEEIVSEIKAGEGTFRHDNMTNKPCPNCGKKLLAVSGKNSRMLVCQDRECGYREVLARTSNARCPNCHKKMELVVKGKEETFVCACGYKERLSAFKERREREGAGVGKRDVQRYLKEQEKEAASPLNDALAKALSGIKLETKTETKPNKKKK